MDATCTVRAAAPAEETHGRGLAWWFVPDVALVVAIVSLFYILVPFDGTQNLLKDSDGGWHIRNGEAILSGKGLPHADPYSLTRSGDSWFAWEWGADVIMGALHRWGGMAAVTGFFAAMIGVSGWMWMRLSRRLGGHFVIAAVLMPVCLTTTQTHWHARPHILSWLLLLGAVFYAERSRRSLWVVAIGSAVWANVHASFFFGAVVCCIYAAGHLLRPLLWSDTDRAREFAEARWFAIAAAVSAVSTLVNPYGWAVHLHIFEYLGNTELMTRIGEFQPFSYYGEGTMPILASVLLSAIGAVLCWTQRRLEHALLGALLIATALRSARGLAVMALLCLPMANAAITVALRDASGLNARLRRWLDAFLQYSDNMWRFDRRFAGPVLAIAVVVLTAFVLRTPVVSARAGFPEKTFPVKAAAYLDKLPRDIRLLSSDLFGGYLIYRFNGELKVYFDGRSDFYGVPFIQEYMSLIEVRAGWQGRLKQGRFDYVLLPKKYSLIPALEGIGWKRVYEDDLAAILKAPTEK